MNCLLAIVCLLAQPALPPAPTNYFVVTAVDQAGAESAPSDVLTTTNRVHRFAWDHPDPSLTFRLKRGRAPGSITNVIWSGSSLEAYWPTFTSMQRKIQIATPEVSLVLSDTGEPAQFFRGVSCILVSTNADGPWRVRYQVSRPISVRIVNE